MASSDERFRISFDFAMGRGRIAMAGSSGSEIILVFPLKDGESSTSFRAEEAILEEGRSRLQSALVALIGKDWVIE